MTRLKREKGSIRYFWATITFPFRFILYFLRQFPLILEQFQQFPAIGSSFPISTASSPIQRNTHTQTFYIFPILLKNTTSKEHLWNMKTCCICNFTNTSSINFSKPYWDCFHITIRHPSFDEYPWHLQYPCHVQTIKHPSNYIVLGSHTQIYESNNFTLKWQQKFCQNRCVLG